MKSNKEITYTKVKTNGMNVETKI